jgi:hypothetical protein
VTRGVANCDDQLWFSMKAFPLVRVNGWFRFDVSFPVLNVASLRGLCFGYLLVRYYDGRAESARLDDSNAYGSLSWNVRSQMSHRERTIARAVG